MNTRRAKPGDITCLDCDFSELEDLCSLPIRRRIPVLWCRYLIMNGRAYPSDRVAKNNTCDRAKHDD